MDPEILAEHRAAVAEAEQRLSDYLTAEFPPETPVWIMLQPNQINASYGAVVGNLRGKIEVLLESKTPRKRQSTRFVDPAEISKGK